MAESRLSPEEPLQFHGGLAGAFAPLLLFALAVACVTAAGMITIQAYFGMMYYRLVWIPPEDE